MADATIGCIDKARRESDAPFFAFCSMVSPHAPLDPPGEWAHLYDGVTLPLIKYTEGGLERLPMEFRRMMGIEPGADERQGSQTVRTCSPEQIDSQRKLYYGLAAYCDHQVGRLVDYLDRSGLRENTLVIFTSDHGQLYYDHGVNDKHSFYDSSWRVPFIMSMPGTLPQGRTEEFASGVDLPATILGAAGTYCDSFQGFDLYSPLRDGRAAPRDFAVGTLYQSVALVTKRWKLSYCTADGAGRLFDRVHDPMEQTDLFLHSDCADVRRTLLEGLLTWRGDICDVHHLKEHTRQGGPVAKRMARVTGRMTGTDADKRLVQKKSI